jgi:hypothetical protein
MSFRCLQGLGLSVLMAYAVSAIAADELGYIDPPEAINIDFASLPSDPPAQSAEEAKMSLYERCLNRSSTALFNEKLMCATRKSFDRKIRSAGAILLAPTDKEHVFQYDVRHIWPGSLYLSVAFAGTRFAVADIAYVDSAAGFDALYQGLFHSLGKPKRVEGHPNGIKGVMWQRGDSIQVWLHRPRKGVLLVSYVRPDLYLYWTRPIVTGKP